MDRVLDLDQVITIITRIGTTTSTIDTVEARGIATTINTLVIQTTITIRTTIITTTATATATTATLIPTVATATLIPTVATATLIPTVATATRIPTATMMMIPPKHLVKEVAVRLQVVVFFQNLSWVGY